MRPIGRKPNSHRTGEKHGGDLWPSDAADKAKALRWLFFESFSLGSQCGTVWWSDGVAQAIGAPAAAEAVIEDAAADLKRALESELVVELVVAFEPAFAFPVYEMPNQPSWPAPTTRWLRRAPRRAMAL